MNRTAFIDFLTDNGCVVVRTDKKGYSILRNVITGKISGVPADDPTLPATVCRICKTLELNALPEEAAIAAEIIEIAHKNHGKN